MIEVEAFAAPYEVASCFNESFESRCFRNNLDKPVPMWLDHNSRYEIGVWDQIWENDKGVWCRGRIMSPMWIRDIKYLLRSRPEISITYNTSNFIFGQQVQNNRRRLEHERERIVTRPNDIRNLVEISMVSLGAFPGTRWKVLNP